MAFGQPAARCSRRQHCNAPVDWRNDDERTVPWLRLLLSARCPGSLAARRICSFRKAPGWHPVRSGRPTLHDDRGPSPDR